MARGDRARQSPLSQLTILMYGLYNHFSFEHNNLNITDGRKTTVEHNHRVLDRLLPFFTVFHRFSTMYATIFHPSCGVFEYAVRRVRAFEVGKWQKSIDFPAKPPETSQFKPVFRPGFV